ncbi:ATP-binding cassette sub-family B member 9 [Anguilla anguilla]|uniref:ATP-binding cassette sub-family B member 9 n=1 Tax=Anguilla anguilla TaxID=7936 RepID=UPI0015B3046B|nr:ATP-binding cassette sub-family B member 9 [Anguilla anguilla]XP_035291592.1 ATP-binding cassette sub-family B member 9 [Anguilla anguilla]
MRTAAAVCCSLLLVLADVVVTTVLYVRGSHPAVFAEDARDFDVFRSVLDLWGLLLVRASLLVGGAVGVSRNRADGPGRASALGPVCDLLCLVVTAYALAKLLVFSEQGSLVYDPWFLGLFGWTCGSAVGTACLWRLLARSRDAVADGGGGRGGGKEESERLVDPAAAEEEVDEEAPGEEEEEERKGAKDGPHSGATVGRLLSYCRKDAGLLTVAFIFLLLSAICEAFIPYYTGLAIDGIVIHKSMEHFTKPMVTLTVLALVSSIAIGVRGGVFSVTFARLNVRLRNLLFRSLMRQEIGFFDANHTGDITSRLTSDTTQVSDLISENVNLFLRSLVKALGFCFFMFGMSWKLTVVTIMGFPFIAVISALYGEYYKKLTKEVQDALAQANKLAEETVSAMRTVRSFATEEQEADSYYARLQDMFQLNKKQALAYACYMWSSCISELALQVGILFYGGHLVVSGQMSGGTLISFFIYELELGECLESIASVYTGLMKGVGAAEKVFEHIDRKPRLARDGREAPEVCKGLVEFQNVTFAYPTRPEAEILKDVSFAVRPGEVTALVGPSGSGKSSCVSLLENFYAPLQGQVLLDGRPVHTYQHSYLHSQVALVGQEPVLFARSILKNISYGLTDTPMDAVVQAATKANAHDFICSLSKGYDTGVGEKGAQLSGGQKQRVAIARALVRNPHVLILDEATSALDAESEHVVQQALNDVMRDSTVLVVAHRLSTVERADNIVVIDRGRVAEQGPHRELMARGGLYCKLVQRQVLGAETGAEALNASPSSPREPARQPESRLSRARDGSESEDGPRY